MKQNKENKLREVMENESIDRFGKMDNYMERKEKDEPFVWDVGAWLAYEINDKKNNGIMYPTGKIKMLDIGPAIGAVSSYITLNAILKGNGEEIKNVELNLCDISKEVINKTINVKYEIPYSIFESKIGMNTNIVNKITTVIQNAKGKVGKVQRLPYPNKTFDLTVANYILHHIPNIDKGKAAKEIQRVTKNNGFIFISDECIPSEQLEQYFNRHKNEDIPLAKEEFMPLKQLLRRFDKIYLQGFSKGNEHYAFYGLNCQSPMLWQHNEFIQDRNLEI